MNRLKYYKRLCLFTWSSCFVLATALNADVLPPGHHSVNHAFCFEGVEKFPRYEFYLFPCGVPNGQGQPKRIEEGEPLGFYKLASPRVYAVPTGTPFDVDSLGDNGEPGGMSDGSRIAVSEKRMRRIHSVPSANPTRDIRTAFEISGVKGGMVQLKHVSSQCYDDTGRLLANSSSSPASAVANVSASRPAFWWMAWLLVAMVTLGLGLFVLRLWRNPSRRPTPN